MVSDVVLTVVSVVSLAGVLAAVLVTSFTGCAPLIVKSQPSFHAALPDGDGGTLRFVGMQRFGDAFSARYA